MAKKVMYVDDVTGDPIDEGLGGTVEFSFDGDHYEIDLGVQTKDEFRKVLKPYISVAREVEPPRPERRQRAGKRADSGSGRSKEELSAIRDWLTKNGHEVSPRGRIAAPLLQLFDESHKS